jgi:putative oxidoreductase
MLESPITEKTSVNQPAWLTLFRIILGLVLFWKGIVFIRDTAQLEQMIQQTRIGIFSQNSQILSFVISYLSLLCGLFILTGLFTRTSCLVQIPILLVAIFFVNAKNIGESGSELIVSIVVLAFLVLFAVKGSGTLSADEFFRTYYKAGTEDGQTDGFFKKQ